MIPFVGPLDLARGIFAIFTFSSHWPHRIVADLDLRCWGVGDGESPNYETRYEEHWFGDIRKHGHVWADVGTGRLQLNGSVSKSSSRGTCTMRYGDGRTGGRTGNKRLGRQTGLMGSIAICPTVSSANLFSSVRRTAGGGGLLAVGLERRSGGEMSGAGMDSMEQWKEEEEARGTLPVSTLFALCTASAALLVVMLLCSSVESVCALR